MRHRHCLGQKNRQRPFTPVPSSLRLRPGQARVGLTGKWSSYTQFGRRPTSITRSEEGFDAARGAALLYQRLTFSAKTLSVDIFNNIIIPNTNCVFQCATVNVTIIGFTGDMRFSHTSHTALAVTPDFHHPALNGPNILVIFERFPRCVIGPHYLHPVLFYPAHRQATVMAAVPAKECA
jgi:hypothetical protein